MLRMILSESVERFWLSGARMFEQLLSLSLILVEIDAFGQCHDGSFLGDQCAGLSSAEIRQKRVLVVWKVKNGLNTVLSADTGASPSRSPCSIGCWRSNYKVRDYCGPMVI